MRLRRQPEGVLEHLEGVTYRYRGWLFSLYRSGRLWGSMGCQPPLTEKDREWNRSLGLPEDTPGLVGLCHEAGWLHARKNSTLRAICVDIDKEIESKAESDKAAEERERGRAGAPGAAVALGGDGIRGWLRG